MRIKKIKCRGLIGLQRGMKLEEVELDLSGIRGICAIIGQNGRGKSTLIEAIQPFRIFPSRKILLKDAVYLRDSYKDVTLEMNGQEIRVLNTADAKTGAMDGYLWIDGVPKSTGKVTEQQEALVDRFGDPDLFFSSVFASQAAESLLSLKPAKRKEFFVDFLHLSRYQEYSEKAKSVAGRLAGKLDGLNKSIQRLAEDAARLPESRRLYEVKRSRKSEIESSIGRTEQSVELLDSEVRDLEAKSQKQAGIQDAIRGLIGRIQEVHDAHAKSAKHWTDEEHRLNGIISDARQKIGKYESERSQLLQSDCKAAASYSGRDTADIEGDIAVARVNYEYQIQLTSQIQDKTADYNNKSNSIRADLAASKRLSVLADKIPPIADRDICRSCGFAVAAIEAVDAQVKLEADLTALRNQFEETIVPLRNQLNGGSAEKLVALEKELISARQAIDAYAKAESAGLDRKLRIKELDQWIHQTESVIIGTADETRKTAKAKYASEFAEADGWMAGLESELAYQKTLIDAAIDLALQTKRASLTAMRSTLATSQREAESMMRAVAILESDIQRYEQAAEELESQRAQIQALDAERAEWVMLQQICGRDNIQALELDAAAPAITSIANNLLGECFGGRFSIRFETMSPEGREVFDVMVRDAEGGGDEALSLKSGGQKVLILGALRWAISIFAKEQSGRDFKTCFCDEIDGSLSPDVRYEFSEMTRKAMQFGGFETCFIISHSSEVIESADHVIEFGESGITVR